MSLRHSRSGTQRGSCTERQCHLERVSGVDRIDARESIEASVPRTTKLSGCMPLPSTMPRRSDRQSDALKLLKPRASRRAGAATTGAGNCNVPFDPILLRGTGFGRQRNGRPSNRNRPCFKARGARFLQRKSSSRAARNCRTRAAQLGFLCRETCKAVREKSQHRGTTEGASSGGSMHSLRL